MKTRGESLVRDGLAAVALAALAATALAGCPATRQARTVQPSGFLGAQASLLKPGTGDDPRLYYVDPAVNWAGYTKVLLDPVTIWRDPATKDVSQANAQAVANNFHSLVYAALAKDYQMVTSPGPATLRMQIALTELDATDVVMNVVSTAIPQLRVATGLEGYATGKPLFTGEAGMAFKVTDAATNDLLSEGVDARVGSKHIVDAWKKWADVDASLRYWADMFRYEFCQNRHGQGCVPPDAGKTF